MDDRIITLEREGKFSVAFTHSHKHQCGNVGTTVLDFKVSISGRKRDLNPRGWLLDNNAIPRYFATTYRRVKDFQSCERIALKACEDLSRLCRESGSTPNEIKVSVSGIPGSWISSHWKAPAD